MDRIVPDALLVGPWPEFDHRSEGYRRPPTDFAAEHVLLRTVRCAARTCCTGLPTP